MRWWAGRKTGGGALRRLQGVHIQTVMLRLAALVRTARPHKESGMSDAAKAPYTDGDRNAAHVFLNELRSRIATQALPYSHGDEATALESLYKLFGRAREIIEENKQCKTFADETLKVLNEDLRPFTAEWHRRSLAGELKTRDGGVEFRQQLVDVQAALRGLAKKLYRIAYDGAEMPEHDVQAEVFKNPKRLPMDGKIRYGIPEGGTQGKPEGETQGRGVSRLAPADAKKLNDKERESLLARRAAEAEEAEHRAKEAEHRAKEAERLADEAEAEHRAEDAKQAADPEGQRRADEAKQQADTARSLADEAKQQADTARRLADEAKQRAQGKADGHVNDAVGLALSGGGIRSASFCLGGAQVLADRKLLDNVDVLSTVSGGGYTGAFLVRRMAADGQKAVAKPHGPDTEAIRYLRQRADFLLNSGRRANIRMIAGLLAGMVMNWFPLAAIVAAITAVVLGLNQRFDVPWWDYAPLAATVSGGAAILAFMVLYQFSRRAATGWLVAFLSLAVIALIATAIPYLYGWFLQIDRRWLPGASRSDSNRCGHVTGHHANLGCAEHHTATGHYLAHRALCGLHRGARPGVGPGLCDLRLGQRGIPGAAAPLRAALGESGRQRRRTCAQLLFVSQHQRNGAASAVPRSPVAHFRADR